MTQPIEPTTRTVHTNGVDLHLVEAGSGFPVVLCHGFPELAYSWRHQIPALAAAGYHVLAPDQRGYGASSRPERVEDYDIEQLTDDLVGLLDDIGAPKAVFVGHDWGAMVVWAMAQRHPDRVAGVVGMSVPFAPRGPMKPIELMKMVMGDNFFYMLYFQDPVVADADLSADVAHTMRGFLAGVSAGAPADDMAEMFGANDGRGLAERLPNPQVLPAWLSQDEVDTYVEAFTRTGFFGPTAWYANLDRNWERSEHLADTKITVPALFVTGSADPVGAMMPASVMDGWVTDLRGSISVEGAGHWVQQERPDDVNTALLEFLGALDLG
jgi:pimeloyl-ACP methyl ester carboxylesterase